MASINERLSTGQFSRLGGVDMFEVVPIKEALPPGFEVLRHAADGEAFDMLSTLAREWASGENRFDKPGEALLAAFDGQTLAGIGAMSLDPHVEGALRMRRFYVKPPYRRRGVGRALAKAMLDRPEVAGRTVTLNAPHAEAARFWEALGFVRDMQHGHTHIRLGPYAHA
jgi:GNAT superfamily N-acetyltransferase